MLKRSVLLLLGLLVAMLLPSGCSAPSSRTIRVLTYNIHHGAGMDGRIDLPRIAAVIRASDADLVALQEVDRGVLRTSCDDQPAILGRLTGMHAVFEKNADMQGGDYGNAILSRLPIEAHRNRLLPNCPNNEQRGLLEVTVRIGRHPIVFYATHLDHQDDDGERLASIALLREALNEHPDTPIIVAGDLNALPASRVLADARDFLQDADRSTAATLLTYPADQPERKIDYVLYAAHPALRCTACRVIPESVASDHRPFLAEFEFRPAERDH